MALGAFLKFAACCGESWRSGLGLDLGAALGAGDDDLALAHGDAADGAAALAVEVLVVLVGVALLGTAGLALYLPPPGGELPVLLLALGKVPGEHPEHQVQPAQGGGPGEDGTCRAFPDEDGQDVDDQQHPEEHLVQLVQAVAAVHEADEGIPYFVKKVHFLLLCRCGGVFFLLYCTPDRGH